MKKPKGFASWTDFKNNVANIWSWNVNGCSAMIEKGKLVDFIQKTNPDILCLNETKIDF